MQIRYREQTYFFGQKASLILQVGRNVDGRVVWRDAVVEDLLNLKEATNNEES